MFYLEKEIILCLGNTTVAITLTQDYYFFSISSLFLLLFFCIAASCMQLRFENYLWVLLSCKNSNFVCIYKEIFWRLKIFGEFSDMY